MLSLSMFTPRRSYDGHDSYHRIKHPNEFFLKFKDVKRVVSELLK